MPSARWPCSVIFSRLLGEHPDDLVDLGAHVLVERGQRRIDSLLQFVQQLDRQDGEIVDEVQRVLDLVRDAGSELTQRGHLLGLDQVGLRRLQLAICRSPPRRAQRGFPPRSACAR